MLKLVLGGSGSGKTACLYSQLTARAKQKLPSILLVPEQFTSSTEGRIYRELGDELSGYVDSFSFTSLAEKILETQGGAAAETLTDAGRAVLIRRTLEQLQDSVHYYYKHRKNAAFCQMAAQTIEELKNAGLAADELCRFAAGNGADGGKLAELGLIYKGYETLLARTGMDPADRIMLAAQKLEEQLPPFMEGCSVFIDECDIFDAPRKRMMGAMLAALPEVTVALCDDGAPMQADDAGLFSGAKKTIAQLRQLARKNGAEVAVPLVLHEDLRHKEAPGLAAAARLLAGEKPEEEYQQADEIRLYAAPSREEEARAAAGAIRRLMRQGVRCSKIAVVCREPANYRAAVRYEFRMAKIPLYCDGATTPEFSAPAAAVRALLELVRGVDYTENMTALAKTGLPALSEEEVCALENYAYTWAPRAAEWWEPFTKSPRGFGDAPLSEDDQHTLEMAENARAYLAGPVEKLRNATRAGTAEQISRALYFCLNELGAEQRQAEQVDALRQSRGIPAAEEAAREWNVVMGLLDQMARLLGEQEVTAAEYADLFVLLLRASDLGHIPQALDAVLFTSAVNMRLDTPEYVFVLGLAEEEFPAAPAETGLLSHADRDALARCQIDLQDCFENQVVREQVCFYKALTAPSRGLWLSWPKGAGVTLCAAVQPIIDALQPEPPELELADMAATPESALDCLGGGWQMSAAERSALTEALAQENGEGIYLPTPDRLDRPRRLNDLPALAGLLGRQLNISPSQLEKYYSCPYGYFLQYVLGLRPRRKAEMTPDQSGSLMHWVLQMALEPQPGEDNPCRGLAPIAELSDEQIAERAAMLVDEYARRCLPESTARLKYLLSRMKRSMAELLCYLRDEQAQSRFETVACEVRIGAGGLMPWTDKLSGGQTVRLIGKIDRADEWVDEDGTRWVRVVDYKTGTKKLNLREVYCGLDCQMLLYLFSLTRDKNGRFTGTEPAGVLYLLADPSPRSTTHNDAKNTMDFELDGLVLAEQKIYEAMDAGMTGKYLPFSCKNGKPGNGVKAHTADERKLERIQNHLDGLVTGMGERLYDGEIDAVPLVPGQNKSPCRWCDYGFVCCHEDGGRERSITAPKNPFDADEAESDAEAEAKDGGKEVKA